jgi:hypothetical protein
MKTPDQTPPPFHTFFSLSHITTNPANKTPSTLSSTATLSIKRSNLQTRSMTYLLFLFCKEKTMWIIEKMKMRESGTTQEMMMEMEMKGGKIESYRSRVLLLGLFL